MIHTSFSSTHRICNVWSIPLYFRILEIDMHASFRHGFWYRFYRHLIAIVNYFSIVVLWFEARISIKKSFSEIVIGKHVNNWFESHKSPNKNVANNVDQSQSWECPFPIWVSNAAYQIWNDTKNLITELFQWLCKILRTWKACNCKNDYYESDCSVGIHFWFNNKLVINGILVLINVKIVLFQSLQIDISFFNFFFKFRSLEEENS